MRPELHAEMMKHVDQEKLAKAIPKEVILAIESHGFDKVAAELLGLPGISEGAAAMYVGRKLAARSLERQQVNAGLAALASLSK